MSKRVLALVQRTGNGTNITDMTPTVVWDHEVPILEELHGTVDVIDESRYEELLDRDVRENREEILAEIIKSAGLGAVFTGSPEDEYARLINKYGLHPEVKVPAVEKVYGSLREGRFKQACGGYSEMTAADLRKILDDAGVQYPPSAKKAELIQLVQQEAA